MSCRKNGPQRARVTGGADHDADARHTPPQQRLPIGEIELRLGPAIETAVMDIAHDADDLRRLAPTQIQALADDVFSREIGARERPVHDNHSRGCSRCPDR